MHHCYWAPSPDRWRARGRPGAAAGALSVSGSPITARWSCPSPVLAVTLATARPQDRALFPSPSLRCAVVAEPGTVPLSRRVPHPSADVGEGENHAGAPGVPLAEEGGRAAVLPLLQAPDHLHPGLRRKAAPHQGGRKVLGRRGGLGLQHTLACLQPPVGTGRSHSFHVAGWLSAVCELSHVQRRETASSRQRKVPCSRALTIYSARNLNYSLSFCTALAVFSGPFPRLRLLLGEVLQLIEQES